jgi:hypothetical protein
VAFVGSEEWVEGCAPAASVHGLITARLGSAGAADPGRIGAALAAFRPHATVIFDPPSWPLEGRRESLGVTLGVLVSGAADEDALRDIGHLDRLVCFDPALTGARIGAHEVWRAIPPPVSDALFGKVRPLHHAPRAMAIGRSSAHREAMLMPAKHHHDLLQIIHGVSGQSLRELLDEHDVGVYFSPEPGGGFGQQAGVHLAAGHLLLAEQLTPEHGLERNIDYLQIDSPEELVWVLDRLGRFPEMHHRIRIRGRLKAEQYRASRLFGRLVHDLLFDLAAFGSRAGAAS